MHPSSTRRRRRAAALLAGLVTLALAVPASSAAATGLEGHRGRSTTDLGPQVLVFDPSMPVAEIQAAVDGIYAQQVDDEMGSARWSLLFLPGSYGTDAEPLQLKVGYDTEVAGLGASPSDVRITGKIEAYNRCLSDDPSNPNCIALVNFWRTLSNLTLDISGTGQDGCRASANFWAVSQASSVRRLDVVAGEGEPAFSLMDYCTAGPQYASGGFIADSRFGTVVNGSQQQWLTRNSVVGSWSNAVWNQVFAGVEGAPDDAAFPNPPYTTLEATPVSREKPYLFVDARGRYQVRVPDARTGTRGITWADGQTPGRTVPISEFYVAEPGDAVQRINSQLARGKNLLLTPGVYDVDRSIQVTRPGTVVLGMGHATLTSADGATPVVVSDVPGVVVAGVTIDAGEQASQALMVVGTGPGHGNGHGHGHGPRRGGGTADPITLSDVYFRVGGPHVGRTGVALRIDADDVLVDHTWVWRADHGVEGFTEGVNGDTDRWATNTAANGVVVNGDRVTATGLFVEHFQQFNTVWNGEDGTVVLYQNELPYDPPTQADWTQPDGTLGWSGYRVADDVQRHSLTGAGVYVFNQNDPSIVTTSGFAVPQRPGVRLHHVMTVNLAAGTIEHVVNDVGEAADTTRIGQPVFVTDYPTP
ncbi:hypothetical protein [Actinotalea fermentans]|uniref:Coagulation factor 5/8 type n=1 Tax=Actinotalea fermentans TaxID=43671 RepID=A0A511YWZ5_9CELL|nr:hypothetical protein [Actinotalea fermentans]KGM15515.1 hypothetical protein N867_07890 [Actinotalea fermentans ATCC 43279 = JCM 9966 = DSM 3133]GEN79699.1 coagulation factor 5/8 type [Actinotalea fermentans]